MCDLIPTRSITLKWFSRVLKHLFVFGEWLVYCEFINLNFKVPVNVYVCVLEINKLSSKLVCSYSKIQFQKQIGRR